MAEDLIPLLAKFHRDVLLPDVKRVVAEAVEASERRLRDEMQTGLDGVAHELKDLRELLHMVDGGLKRVEERLEGLEQRMDRVEQRLDKLALRSELLEIKSRMDGLQEQVRILEARLDQ